MRSLLLLLAVGLLGRSVVPLHPSAIYVSESNGMLSAVQGGAIPGGPQRFHLRPGSLERVVGCDASLEESSLGNHLLPPHHALRLRGGDPGTDEVLEEEEVAVKKKRKVDGGKRKNPQLFSERRAGLPRGGDISSLPEPVQKKIEKKRSMREMRQRKPDENQTRSERTVLRRAKKEKVPLLPF